MIMSGKHQVRIIVLSMYIFKIFGREAASNFFRPSVHIAVCLSDMICIYTENLFLFYLRRNVEQNIVEES